MNMKEFRKHTDYLLDDVEINIVSTSLDPERNFTIDNVVFDTCDQLFIEISGGDLFDLLDVKSTKDTLSD